MVIKSTKSMLLLLLIAMHGFSQNVVKIQSGGSINLQGNVVITLQNIDLDNDGSINPAVNAGRFVFKGSANNVVQGNGTTNFDQLEIAKTGSGQLTIQTNTSTRSGIWLNGGNIIANDRVITLLGNAALNGESEISRVIATNDGYVQASMQLNAPVNINPGNLGAIISSNQDMGFTSIRRGNQQQSLAAGRTSIQRYFDISPQNNTNLNATLRLHYTDAELDDQAEGAIEVYTSENFTTWTK